ncbi:MAG: hypothetical protein ACOCP8_05880 [archaeon]
MIKIAKYQQFYYCLSIYDQLENKYYLLMALENMIQCYFNIKKIEFKDIISKYNPEYNGSSFYFLTREDAKNCKEYLEGLMVFNKLII